MCKPKVTDLGIKFQGPCGFNVRSHSDACAAFSLGETWRVKVANVLRRWADKAEGVKSMTVIGYGPSQITYDDVLEGATVGFNGGAKYLNDLWRDRVFGSTDTEVRAITPTKTIS